MVAKYMKSANDGCKKVINPLMIMANRLMMGMILMVGVNLL